MNESTHPPARADYADARVAVLGAAGFIGRWVARALGAQGAKTYLTVRNRRAAGPLFERYGVSGEIVELDLQDLSAVRDTLRAIAPSITFNLAGYGVDHTEQDEADAYRINSDLVGAVCEALADLADLKWIGQALVHVGSALEYGEIGGDLTEDRQPDPTTLYGRSKLAGTERVADWSRRSALPAVVARLFTVYGPGEYPNRLLPALLRTANTGEDLPLSSGNQRRDFTYVEDVAEGLLRVGAAPRQSGTIVNLATGQLTSVRSFVETAAGILDIPRERLRLGLIPTRFTEMEHAALGLDRLRALACWVPTIGIANGIRKTWEFESCTLRHLPGRLPMARPARSPSA